VSGEFLVVNGLAKPVIDYWPYNTGIL